MGYQQAKEDPKACRNTKQTQGQKKTKNSPMRTEHAWWVRNAD